MAKLIIPATNSEPLVAMGLSRLDKVDCDIVGEILGRLEGLLRQKPRIISLTDAAMLCMYNKDHHADATMLLTLAREAGEPMTSIKTKPQPGQTH